GNGRPGPGVGDPGRDVGDHAAVPDHCDLQPGLRAGGEQILRHRLDLGPGSFIIHAAPHSLSINYWTAAGRPNHRAPGHVCLQTVTFAEHGDATLMRAVLAFQSVEDRDAMVASDMERGTRDSGDRLDELLAKLAVGRPCYREVIHQ